MRKPNKYYVTVFIFGKIKKQLTFLFCGKYNKKKTLLSFSLIPYTTKTTSEGGTTVNFFRKYLSFRTKYKEVI